MGILTRLRIFKADSNALYLELLRMKIVSLAWMARVLRQSFLKYVFPLDERGFRFMILVRTRPGVGLDGPGEAGLNRTGKRYPTQRA